VVASGQGKDVYKADFVVKKILHICAGWQKWNGAANIARMIMDEQRREGHEVSFAIWTKVRELRAADEVWIHCGWLPCLWWAALWGRDVRWMPEACYDPVRLKFHGWKKWLVGPIERWCLRRCDRIVATCEAEKGWIERYLGKKCPPVEVTDIKWFFRLKGGEAKENWRRGILPRQMGEQGATSVATLTRLEAASPIDSRAIHLLYLGRSHPLKGVAYLEKAVAELNSNPVNPVNPAQKTSARSTRLKTSASQRLCVKIISNAYGEELEKVWAWCDVLVLPTLSENFGLVIAEALERGKRVITTDGAPAWGAGLTGLTGFTGLYSGYEGRLIYLKGYRDGTPEERVGLLKCAIMSLVSGLTSK